MALSLQELRVNHAQEEGRKHPLYEAVQTLNCVSIKTSDNTLLLKLIQWNESERYQHK